MRKDAYKRIDALSTFTDELILTLSAPVVNEMVEESSLKPADSLLSLVYRRDERTGLPTGDLSYLVSDKANPEVKQFILDNLMQDVSAAKNVSAPAGLSADDVLALSRNSGESIADYAARLNQSIDRDKWILSKYKQNVQSKSTNSTVSAE